MIKDMTVIRKELDGYIEIELPYDLEKGCHIKYITKKKMKILFIKVVNLITMEMIVFI